jgi:hypothetical protein
MFPFAIADMEEDCEECGFETAFTSSIALNCTRNFRLVFLVKCIFRITCTVRLLTYDRLAKMCTQKDSVVCTERTMYCTKLHMHVVQL